MSVCPTSCEYVRGGPAEEFEARAYAHELEGLPGKKVCMEKEKVFNPVCRLYDFTEMAISIESGKRGAPRT